jgi:AraC-like DNA-binding protein
MRLRISAWTSGLNHRTEPPTCDCLRVVIFDCSFDDRRVFNVVDEGCLRMNFSLSIQVDMAFGDKLRVQATEPSWRFIQIPKEQTAVEVVAAKTRLQWVTVVCRPELLEELTGTNMRELPSICAEELQDPESVIYRCFQFTPILKEATAAIMADRMKGRMRAPYIAAKAQELLVLGLDHMLRAGSQPPPVRLTDRDVHALHAIRELVDSNLSQMPTVNALSLKVGMNRTKLFYGFKSLFGVSLSQHMQDQRIQEGYRLLTTTDEPVGEIAARVGFRHQCNFSTAFRARYGVSPHDTRRGAARRQT